MRTLQTVRCMMCGESMLSDADGYTEHVRRKHSMGEGITCRPVKTSARTTAEIVAAVEERLRPFIIGGAPAHADACRCMECFNRQLDLIAAGEHITWNGEDNEQIRADDEN